MYSFRTDVFDVHSQNSSTYWEGKADMETLQRIYGISFPDSKMLKEWEKFQEEAKNRDHRKLGRVCVDIYCRYKYRCVFKNHLSFEVGGDFFF